MSIKDETGKDFSALNEVKLSAEDKNDILQNLRKEMASQRPRRKRNMAGLPGVAAAVAAVAVVAGGFGLELHTHHLGSSSNHPTTASNQVSNQTQTNSVQPTNSAQQNNSAQSGNSANPAKTTLPSGIEAQTYNTSTAAANAITNIQKANSYLPFAANNPPVNLGLGISAKQDGGLDHYGLQWHEGNWTVETLWFGGNQGGEQMAKNMVAYLHTHMLPAPHDHGVIIVNSTDPNSTTIKPSTIIAWQEGNQVYQLKQTGDPVRALTTVVNSNGTGQASGQPSNFQQTFKSSGASSQVFLSPNIGFQVTNLGGGMNNFKYQFSKTTDGGKTWTKMSTGHYSHINGISFINENTGYLLNNSPAYAVTPDLFVTHDGGATWTEQKLPIPSAYKNAYRSSDYPIFFSPTVGFIPVYGLATQQSTTNKFLYMLVTTDGGKTWTPYTSGKGGGLSWTLTGQKLSVANGSQTITVNGLFGAWKVSTGQ